MVQSNFLECVLFVRFHRKPGETGTAFTVEVDNQQYIVTAAHVVEGIANSDVVGIFYTGGFQDTPARRVHLNHEVDVAVLATTSQITPALPIVLSTEGLILSQDVY